MKTCVKCQATKPDEQFYAKDKKTTHSYCKNCFNGYCMERWTQRKRTVVEQLGGRCLDCQSQYPLACYEFHHLNQEQKEHSWTKMRLMSETRMQEELAKCVLLCANCHRIRHYSSD